MPLLPPPRTPHRMLVPLLVTAAAIGLACAPSDEPGGDASAALVPADAVELEAYLKGAVQQAQVSDGWRMLMDTTAAPPAAPGSPGAPEADFSTTTLQTAGVDEADLVKFDGETLFVARQRVYGYPVLQSAGVSEPAAATAAFAPPAPDADPAAIAVYTASDEPAEATPIATIPLPEASAIEGMILLPGGEATPPLLVVIGSDYDVTTDDRRLALDAFYAWGVARVGVWIFDVSEPSEPRALHRSKIEGSLVAVRRIRGQLVLVTRYSPDLWPVPYEARPVPGAPLFFSEEDDAARADELAELELQDLLPRRWSELPEAEAPRPLVEPGDCFVPRQRADADASLYYHPTLVTVSMIDLRAPDEPVSICAAGPVDRVYSSTRALYLAATSWRAESQTVVHKFAYTERGPEFRGSGVAAGVPGGSDPDFGLGELGDVFGIMTTITSPTDFQPSARLTLLAERAGGARGLVEVSHLPNAREPDPIGKPGEQLYAVRFVGERVYAVTFRRIDPLYVIDAEDPRNPFIAGELEIPGFSDSLHPVAPHLLLGIGKDSIADDGFDWFQGVKVELFDVSDASRPESVDAIVIGRRGSDTAARTEHHAFTALDMGDGTTRIAIPVSVAESESEAPDPDDPRAWHPWARTGLHLFEVDQASPALREAGELIVAEAGEESWQPSTWLDRSRLQGDAVHYVHGGEVWSAPWAMPEDAVGPQ